MDFEYISSKENKLVKSIKKLVTSSKERREKGMFVLEGLRLCTDAAVNGYKIDTVVVSDDLESSDSLDAVVKVAKSCIKMPSSLFNSLCDTVSPQGILCVVKVPETVKDISSVDSGKYIILENTSDPANLGAIARTAEAFGISGLIISSCGCDPFSPKAQRAGMGALLRLPIFICDDIIECVNILRNKNIKCYASVVSGAETYVTEHTFEQNCAVLIGNEANGLTETVKSVCDKRLTIKMTGRAESLNAAAAAAIFIWEMTKAGAFIDR